MDNPTINEEIQPTPQVISEEIKPKKSFVKPLLIILKPCISKAFFI